MTLPSRLGKYEILREVGRGGKGVVYEALDTVLRRKVALKTIRPDAALGPEERRLEEERFLVEARLGAFLPKHPHIVGIYEAGEVDGRRFLAMEFVEGSSLGAWRRSGAATLPLLVAVLRDVALAADHAHRHGVIHRDLKPNNVIVDAGRSPHLTDFGIARLVGQQEDPLAGAGTRVWGTAAYMSPERARKAQDADHRADIFSLGVMLYEILCGQLPFRGATTAETMTLVAREPVPPFTKHVKPEALTPLHRALEPACMKAISKDPAARQPNAKAFADDIDRALGSAPASGRRSRALLTGLAAAAVAIIALLGVLLLGSRESAEADLAEADRRMKQKDYAGAVESFTRALTREPGSARAEEGRRAAQQRIREKEERERKREVAAAADAARREEAEKNKESSEELKRQAEARRRADEEQALLLKMEQSRLERERRDADERARAAEEALKKSRDPAPAAPVPSEPPVATPPKPPKGGAPAPAAPTGEAKALEDGSLHWEAEDYTGGAEAVAGEDFNDTTPGNTGKRYRAHDVDLYARPDGTTYVADVAAGEWLRYRFQGGGRFQPEFSSSGKRGGHVRLEVDGKDVTGRLALPGARDFSVIAPEKYFRIPPGEHVVRLVFESTAGLWIDWFRLRKAEVHAPPDAAAQKEAEKIIRDAYKTDFARRAPADIVALAKKLLEEGRKIQDDPVGKFVFLSQARELAGQGADVATALDAVEELARRFEVDAASLRSEALSDAIRAVRTPEAAKAAAEACLAEAEQLAGREDFESAADLARRAEAPARSSRDPALAARAGARAKEYAAERDTLRPVKAAQKKLEESPDDPAANLAVGLHRCFAREDWDGGLPFLAKGSDAELAALAEKDLADPKEPAEQAALGDAWREAGAKRSGDVKNRLLARALDWYEKSVPGLAGLAKVKVEGQIETIHKSFAASFSVSRGLVFWIEPGKYEDPSIECLTRTKGQRVGATVPDAGPGVLTFGGANSLRYNVSETVKAVERTGAIFAWVKSDDYKREGGVVTRGDANHDDLGLWVGGGQVMSRFNFPENKLKTASTGTLAPGKWTLIGMAWDDRVLVFYVDGKESGATPHGGTPKRMGGLITVGDNPVGGSQFYTGLVGAVYVYNRTIGAVEALQLFTATRARHR